MSDRRRILDLTELPSLKNGWAMTLDEMYQEAHRSPGFDVVKMTDEQHVLYGRLLNPRHYISKVKNPLKPAYFAGAPVESPEPADA